MLEAERPDLVLLDVMMPGMSGYEVCRAIRADPAHAMLPVVLVTALDPAQERAKGLDAGADDFLSKPVSQAELLARVRSLLRIKSLYDEVLRQSGELAELNRTLEQRVADGVAPAREGRPAEALLLAAARRADRRRRRRRPAEEPSARDHRRLPRPARLHRVHRDRRSRGGDGRARRVPRRDRPLVLAHEGTLERFTGDGIMVFFNDPVQVPDPAPRAARMAIAMQREVGRLAAAGRSAATTLAMGVGIAQGFATIGGIGFPGRIDYGAIGTVTNLAARLCGEARGGEILVSQRVLGAARGRRRAPSRRASSR